MKKWKKWQKKKNSKERKGCVNKPQVNIEPENVVGDERHLLLRVMDKLLANLIQDLDTRDKNEIWEAGHRRSSQPGIGRRLKTVETAIKECQITFAISRKKNDDGSESDALEWTSLLGREKKSLLEKLPQKLNNILPASTVDVTKLWNASA